MTKTMILNDNSMEILKVSIMEKVKGQTWPNLIYTKQW